MLEKITGGYKTKAVVVDDVLVLSFPDAQNPSVWRMALDSAQSCVFELSSNSKTGCFELVQRGDAQRKAGGGTKVIATYDSRPKALRALIQTSQALEKGSRARQQQTSMTGESNAQGRRRSGWLGRAILIVMLLAVAYMLYVVAATISSVISAPPLGGVSGQQQQQPAGYEAPRIPDGARQEDIRNGLPVPADDFLNQLEQQQPGN